eukprot:m.148071 g.148071  ORF g.148071 m.148071 type:complete len:76 (-) comp13247_c3_seq7:1073-1300(-)
MSTYSFTHSHIHTRSLLLVLKDGKEDTLQGRPRYLIGADGEAERMQTVRISDFFVEREKRAFKHEYGEDGIIFED